MNIRRIKASDFGRVNLKDMECNTVGISFPMDEPMKRFLKASKETLYWKLDKENRLRAHIDFSLQNNSLYINLRDKSRRVPVSPSAVKKLLGKLRGNKHFKRMDLSFNPKTKEVFLEVPIKIATV